MPSCSHSTFAPIATASRATSGRVLGPAEDVDDVDRRCRWGSPAATGRRVSPSTSASRGSPARCGSRAPADRPRRRATAGPASTTGPPPRSSERVSQQGTQLTVLRWSRRSRIGHGVSFLSISSSAWSIHARRAPDRVPDRAVGEPAPDPTAGPIVGDLALGGGEPLDLEREHLVDLAVVGDERGRGRAFPRTGRRGSRSRTCDGRQGAEQTEQRGIEPDLLARLAKRGLGERLSRLVQTTGEGDLPA